MFYGVTTMRSERLLALPLRLHGIPLGRPLDLLLDVDEWKVIGLDVLCGDDVHRFLPFPTAVISDEEIAIRSPFVLLEEDQLAFYRQRTVAVSALRGEAVLRDRREVGTLEDVVVQTDGTVAALIVDGRELPVDEAVRMQSRRRVAAVS